jgi:hypothetical protein
MTVEQEEWRAAATMSNPDLRLPGVDRRQFKLLEHSVLDRHA